MLVDDALLKASGRRLSDLERSIFIGSWEGKTYEEIYPLNPEYVEKSVGYKLWKKLSLALGEKVSKKRIRGAVMRHYSSSGSSARLDSCLTGRPTSDVRVAIIWQKESGLSDRVLVHALSNCLEGLGYHVQANVSKHELKMLRYTEFSGLPELQDGDVLVVTFSGNDSATQSSAH